MIECNDDPTKFKCKKCDIYYSYYDDDVDPDDDDMNAYTESLCIPCYRGKMWAKLTRKILTEGNSKHVSRASFTMQVFISEVTRKKLGIVFTPIPMEEEDDYSN